MSLIGERRVGETVAEHELAAFERGENRHCEMLGSRSFVKKELRPAAHLCFENGFSDLLGDRSSAGFAGQADPMHRKPVPPSRRAISRIRVDFPAPSVPSNVTKRPLFFEHVTLCWLCRGARQVKTPGPDYCCGGAGWRKLS